MSEAQIAIIGVGMAGLSCATELAKRGIKSVLFDKGRGPGGRMAARRAEVAGETVRFDHGTRYFTAADPSFAAQVSDWIDAGAVAPWPAAGEGRFVGLPGMNGPLAAMAIDLEVHWSKRVLSVSYASGRWKLAFEDGEREFAHIVVAIPPEQVAELLADVAPEFAALAASVVSHPCWTVMAAFGQRLPIDADVLSDPEAAIWEASRDSAKPGRSGPERWVLQASAEQSRKILECDAADAGEELLALFFGQLGIEPVTPIHMAAHRWRYAAAEPVQGLAARSDAALALTLAGDWLVSADVQGAWLSGRAAAVALEAQ
ncbi:FAD-dependent oxidoreductase [Altererythrobacter sp. ZODW24]|uniref:NAD(P)/FAD-dependent oxidoreductase n=1 Tax=Altererythrobacter sp. ZODW24 TaxID=2185142 RepID=UPI000DF7AF37|nr:FAD-dependent oxidoreductase [Altererythrobacter sp. ZODW24]